MSFRRINFGRLSFAVLVAGLWTLVGSNAIVAVMAGPPAIMPEADGWKFVATIGTVSILFIILSLRAIVKGWE